MEQDARNTVMSIHKNRLMSLHFYRLYSAVAFIIFFIILHKYKCLTTALESVKNNRIKGKAFAICY